MKNKIFYKGMLQVLNIHKLTIHKIFDEKLNTHGHFYLWMKKKCYCRENK